MHLYSILVRIFGRMLCVAIEVLGPLLAIVLFLEIADTYLVISHRQIRKSYPIAGTLAHHSFDWQYGFDGVCVPRLLS